MMAFNLGSYYVFSVEMAIVKSHIFSVFIRNSCYGVLY